MKYQIGDKVKTANAGNGVVCHISGGVDYVHVRTEKHGVVFVHVESLIKLPKYAVGDIVRFKHKKGKNPTVIDKYGFIATIKSCHYDACTLYEYPETYFESCFEPFDGFRMGDTVYTLKRGKGKIIGDVYDSTKRPFAVDFSVPNGMFLKWNTYDGIFYPKLSNLIPTETEYKYLVEANKKPLTPSAERWAKLAEAFSKAATALEAAQNLKKFSDACKKFPSGGIVHQYCPIPDALSFGREPIMKVQVAPSSKFKEGDVVYYKSPNQRPDETCKWVVVRNADFKCVVIEQKGVGLSACLRESDLRLWTETEITHTDTMDKCADIYKLKQLSNPKFIGTHLNGKDIFSEEAGSGKIVIWYGIKGDDI